MPGERVEVGERGIQLGQLLKLVGALHTGGMVKDLLESGARSRSERGCLAASAA